MHACQRCRAVWSMLHPHGWQPDGMVDDSERRGAYEALDNDMEHALSRDCHRVPSGLTALVLVTSIAVRLALLIRVDCQYMLMCGLLQDWKASFSFTLLLCLVPFPIVHELATGAALAHLVLDFGLQTTGGVRLHASTWAMVLEQFTSTETLTALLRNGAMVSHEAWLALAALIPLAVVLRLERRWRPPVSRRTFVMGSAVAILGLINDTPCCRESDCHVCKSQY